MKFLYLFLALALICIISFFSLPYWQGQYVLFLEFYDIAFHTNAAVGFQRLGGFALTNFWAGFSAQGTPNIYFPFLQLVESLLLSKGVSTFFLTYWLSWLFLPLSLVAILLFAYKAYGAKVSLYAVMLLSLSPVWMEKQWGLPPQALVYVLTPLIFLALVKNRYIITAILTLICMATHFTGILLFPFLLLYALQNKSQRRAVLIILGAILLLGLPFIWFALQRIKSIQLSVGLNSTLQGSIEGALGRLFDVKRGFHVYLGWLATIGLIICYVRKNKFLILPSYFLAFFPLAWTTQEIRFWGVPAFFIFSLLGAVALGEIQEWVEKIRHSRLIGLVFFILVFLLAHPLFYFLSQMPIQVKTPTLIFLKTPAIWLHPRPFFSWPEKLRIIDLVKEKVEKDEFFWINLSHNFNNFIALNTYRSTLSSPRLGIMPAQGIKLVVMDKNPPSDDYVLLEKINAQYNTYVLREPEKAAKVKLPKPLLKTEQLKTIFLILGLIILTDLFVWRGRSQKGRPYVA